MSCGWLGASTSTSTRLVPVCPRSAVPHPAHVTRQHMAPCAVHAHTYSAHTYSRLRAEQHDLSMNVVAGPETLRVVPSCVRASCARTPGRRNALI